MWFEHYLKAEVPVEDALQYVTGRRNLSNSPVLQGPAISGGEGRSSGLSLWK